MDSTLIMQIVLAVLVLTAMIVGGFSVKTWRAWNVVAGFLVFICACVLLVLLSMSLKARRHWLKQLDRSGKQYAQLVEENGRLLYGDLTEVVQTEENMQSISAKLGRLMLDRGRAWRQCTPAPLDANGTITVTISTAAAGKPHQIPVNFLLYAFREADAPTGQRLPVTYLGEFQVVAVNETSVQLVATLLAPDLMVFAEQNPTANFTDSFNAAYVNNVTWSLYEMLPVDDHRAFADSEADPDLRAPEASIFGAVNEQEITATLQFIAQFAAVAPAPTTLTNIVNKYLRDGHRATNEDPPEVIYAKVEFVKEYSEKVDSDSPLSALSSEFFDASGQAQIAFLQQGENGTVSIKAGMIAALPLAQANQLVADGTCKLVDRVYVRPLRDFAYSFHSLYDQFVEFRNKIRAQTYNKAQLEEANKNLTLVIQKKQDELSKVESDLGFVKTEGTKVRELATRLQSDLTALQETLRTLFRANLVLEQDLAEVQRKIQESVERAVDEATVAVP